MGTVVIESQVYSKWQTYPYEMVYVRENKPDLLSVYAQNLSVSGKILSIKGKIFRMELDTKSLYLVLRVAKAVNYSFKGETGKTLQSINVFDAGILRFRRREGASQYANFNKLIGQTITIVIRPENVYQGKHYSLNWITTSF